MTYRVWFAATVVALVIAGCDDTTSSSVTDPKDYGRGIQQSVGTAYVEVSTPGGNRGTFYSAELRKIGSRWRVTAVEQKAGP
jgi:hypothetical protein